jgi:hypothetical protein
MQTTMLATSTDQYKQPNSFSVDTDGVYFIINNSANGGICNIKPMFVGDFERHSVTLVTACLISSILPLSSGSNVQLHIMRHITQNKRHAIGITPTREMRLELHLQTCDWNCTYKRDAIRIAPTRLVRYPVYYHYPRVLTCDSA